MQTPTHENLRSLLPRARSELQKESNEYSAFLNELEFLQRSIDANDLPVEMLERLLRAFPAKLKPMRAGAPAGAGLKETRRLWEELNHIVRSRQQGKA
jgi:hypothetical protein